MSRLSASRQTRRACGKSVPSTGPAGGYWTLVRRAKSLINSTLPKRSLPLRFFGARSVPRQACRRGTGGDNIVRDVGAHGDSAVAKKSKAKFDPEAFLAKADGGVMISKYRKGQVVFAQGEPADSVFYIREGRVKIAVVSEQGKEAIVAFLKAGDFIGEGCLTGRPRRVSTARAVEDSVVSRVDKATMVRILRDEQKFSERFTAHLLARTLRVEEDLVDQLFNSSEKRLARALLLLANFGKEGKHEPVIAKVSQETLADMIGTTRSRVSHFMNKFRELGYIHYNGDLEVHSSLLDAVLHEKPQLKISK
jgi:CRP/FNR family transcriptional regulator, cyclic AMP receptor protein